MFADTIKQMALAVILMACALSVQAVGVDVTYYHSDLLGSPVAATDEQGQVKWRKSYKPYGQEIEAATDDEEFVGYTGHRLDRETGLVYAGARHYDPLIGRFYGVDPVGFVAGNTVSFNRYAYVSNNPYKYIDPAGEERVGINFLMTVVLGPVGGKLRVDLSYDTTHGEISLRGIAAAKAGAQLGGKLEAYSEPSNDQPRGLQLVASGKFNAEAVAELKTPLGTASAGGFGEIGILGSTRNGVEPILDGGYDAAASWGPVSVDKNGRKSIGAGGAVGASVGAEVEGEIVLSGHK